MAVSLSSEERLELERVLESPDAIAADPFGLTRRLCALVNAGGGAAGEFPTDVQELLVRALAQRNAFGASAAVLDGLLRERGLFPYLAEETLSVRDQLAYEMHRPLDFGEETVFHRAQARVYHRLLNGENIVLSAPTSFGKSLIIDAVIAEGRHDHVAVIVPTIALIDETRRRLAARFGGHFKIITHADQRPAERDIYVLTPERVPQADGIERVTFFAIDEFYKLDPRFEQDRSDAVNEALYRLRARGAQFYLLGPNIDDVPASFLERYRCAFERTEYATVATEVRRVYAAGEARGPELVRIVSERTGLGEPTLVYCGSPESARTVAAYLASRLDRPARDALAPAAAWAGDAYHPEWSFVAALARGIGLHHGRMPRALQQLVTRAFNDGTLDVLVCTSTLIEGVNTTAKNVVVYDHRIGDRPLTYFDFHNIKGRSGRMMRHFIGRVYVFSDPPPPTPLAVDVPVATQSESASDSLLIQLNDDDLSDAARGRVQPYVEQDVLPLFVLRENHGIDPGAQIALAIHLRDSAETLWLLLDWTGPRPTADSVRAVCELIWTFFVASGRAPRGAVTAEQLAFLVNRFLAERDAKALIRLELENQAARSQALDPDQAVEDTLDFLRNWASYHFPRYLMAVSRIQQVVFADFDLPPGDYSVLARDIENFFLPAGIAALDEYGIPLQVGRKLMPVLPDAGTLDGALAGLRALAPRRLTSEALGLTPFERELVEDARRHM